YFSLCTSTPPARNEATPHSTAFAICGEPVTRPPTSSVSRRRLSASGDSPITCGRILAAASEHDETSVAEHAPVPCGTFSFCNGSGLSTDSCAEATMAQLIHAIVRAVVPRKLFFCIFPTLTGDWRELKYLGGFTSVRIIAHLDE